MSDQHKLDYPHSALTKGANIALRCSPENDRNTYSDSKWKHVRCKPVLSTTGIVPFCNYHNSCECFLSCCKAGMLYQTFLAALLSEIIYIYILSSFPPFSSPWTVVPQPSVFFPICLFFFFFSARPWLCTYSNSNANIFFHLSFLLTASPILLHLVCLDLGSSLERGCQEAPCLLKTWYEKSSFDFILSTIRMGS